MAGTAGGWSAAGDASTPSNISTIRVRRQQQSTGGRTIDGQPLPLNGNNVTTLIRGATVVLPEGPLKTSVVVKGSRIAAIDPAVHTSADEVVDAVGLHLLPGVIDDQVHFREPGLTHKEDLRTASRACAKGGVTTFLEMPNTKPAAITQERLEAKLALAADKCLVNYGFYIGATPHNLDELKAARRTPGIKIFIGSSTGDLLVDDQGALERIFAETTLPICAHCEDEQTVRANAAALAGTTNVADHSRIRDHAAAIIATRRTIDLAHRHRHRFHVLHVSTGAEVELLADHRGLITAEACPHHLLFNIDDYQRLGTLVQMNPSLKTADDSRQLWDGLHAGRIQVIATDHAPHTLEEKARPYLQAPSGLPLVQFALNAALELVHAGRLTNAQVVQKFAHAPAQLFDVSERGFLREGYWADLVMVDDAPYTVEREDVLSKCGWSPFEGTTFHTRIASTWVNGMLAWDGRKLLGEPGGQRLGFAR